MQFIEGIGEILLVLLVTAGGIFLTLLTALAAAYIFGYGFTFGTVAAKRRIGIIAVHAVEEKIEKPFKTAAKHLHEAEDRVKRDVKHDEDVVRHDVRHDDDIVRHDVRHDEDVIKKDLKK